MTDTPSDSHVLKALLAHLGSNPVGTLLEPRIARIESSMEHVQGSLSRVDKEITDIRTEMKELRAELKADNKELHRKVDTHFYINLGFMSTMLGVMAKGFGWL